MMARSFKIFLPLPYSILQGPLENDLVVHVALIAESQRYEIRMGGVFLWEEGEGAYCFMLQYWVCGRD